MAYTMLKFCSGTLALTSGKSSSCSRPKTRTGPAREKINIKFTGIWKCGLKGHTPRVVATLIIQRLEKILAGPACGAQLLRQRRKRLKAQGSDVVFVEVRYLLSWLSGVLLFFKTSLMTAYDPTYTYNVTAGVGNFNASYAQSFLTELHSIDPNYHHQIVPFRILALAYDLIGNAMQVSNVPSITDQC
ncbi:hypothetical protein BDZ45DRAFT_741143 [Acephala macrosclerotiorum]|nr:hypothetical protein BDZ45DRAFT_741143 [Acephala macrosclerotiorum]